MSGTLNSINTNVGAMVALESLNQTNTQLNAAQKQISTGYRVADAQSMTAPPMPWRSRSGLTWAR